MNIEAVDLEIRVRAEPTPGNRTRLRFVLHSPSGRADYTHFQVDGATELHEPPDTFQARMLGDLAKLRDRTTTDDVRLRRRDVLPELEAIGRELYRALFPRSLQTEYLRFRGPVDSLLVISDEPWLPWELLKPHGEDFDDDFLCCRFAMSRWLAGGTAPPSTFGSVARGHPRVTCFVADQPPGAEPLRLAREEANAVRAHAKRYPDAEPDIVEDTTYDAIIARLEVGGSGILHFIGHSAFEDDAPNASPFLTHDRGFRPRDLSPTIERAMRRDRPLVFFNSCQVAQQGYALSRLGGWVPRWLLDCHCGAFVGPLWSVQDSSARCFAESFYAGLADGLAIAEAARRARLFVRQERPSSAAWLAYVVHAHPNATQQLEAATAEEPSAPQPKARGESTDPAIEPSEPSRPEPTSDGRRTPERETRTLRRRPLRPDTRATLDGIWAKVSIFHLAFMFVLFLRNRSIPVLPGLKWFFPKEVAAFFGVIVGLPLCVAIVALVWYYAHRTPLPRPVHKIHVLRRIALRLPIVRRVAMPMEEDLYTTYQLFFFGLFVVTPMFFQGFLFDRLMEAAVWRRKDPLGPYSDHVWSGLFDNLSRFVPWSDAVLGDTYRIGSNDARFVIESVTYFPFWEPWGFFLAELSTLAAALWMLARLASPRDLLAREDRD